MAKEKEYVLLKDITIPKGTKLSRTCEELWWASRMECFVWLWKDAVWTFLVHVWSIEDNNDEFITEIK